MIFGDSSEECAKNVSYTVRLLTSLGFIINLKKSCIVPSTGHKFLGFIFNSEQMILVLLDEKKYNIKKWAHYFIQKQTHRIRGMSRFIGILISACPAVKFG